MYVQQNLTSMSCKEHEVTYKGEATTKKQYTDKVVRALNRTERRRQETVMTDESPHAHRGTVDNRNKRQKISNNNNEQGNNPEKHTTNEKEPPEDPKKKT